MTELIPIPSAEVTQAVSAEGKRRFHVSTIAALATGTMLPYPESDNMTPVGHIRELIEHVTGSEMAIPAAVAFVKKELPWTQDLKIPKKPMLSTQATYEKKLLAFVSELERKHGDYIELGTIQGIAEAPALADAAATTNFRKLAARSSEPQQR